MCRISSYSTDDPSDFWNRTVAELRLRPDTERLPIIMLTARGESDQVRGLGAAPTIMVKPFSGTPNL